MAAILKIKINVTNTENVWIIIHVVSPFYNPQNFNWFAYILSTKCVLFPVIKKKIHDIGGHFGIQDGAPLQQFEIWQQTVPSF